MKKPLKGILLTTVGIVLGAAGLGLLLLSCRDTGPGPGGQYNGKLDMETNDVKASRQKARVIVEKTHQGQLENEDSDFPRKLLWVLPRKAKSVMTFRVPADQFEAAMIDLDNEGVGTVVEREVKDRDDIERRGDLAEIAALLNERLIGELEGEDSDRQAIEAQEKLEEMSKTANFPVLVVELHPRRGPLMWLFRMLLNNLVWILVALGAGYVWGQRSAKPPEPRLSPVIGPSPDDPRQNSPERNPGVQDRGVPT